MLPVTARTKTKLLKLTFYKRLKDKSNIIVHEDMLIVSLPFKKQKQKQNNNNSQNSLFILYMK